MFNVTAPVFLMSNLYYESVHTYTCTSFRNALAKEIAIHKVVYNKTWSNAPYSKGTCVVIYR